MNLSEALMLATEALDKAGVPDARIEAEYLLQSLLGLKRHELFLNSNRLMSEDELKRFNGFVERRVKREPPQYIVGEVDFRGLSFKVTGATLIPRPETELLVEEAVKIAKDVFGGKVSAIDLCTGSGCIAVSFAHELKDCRVYATDISRAALDVAKENAERHGVSGRVEFLEGDLYEPLEGLGTKDKVNLILSNPPYVSRADMKGLQPEIKDYEPERALYGGEDGLDFFRRIIKDAPLYLAKGGYLIMEIGYGQAKSLKEITAKAGYFDTPEVKKDLSGVERVFKARFKGISY